MRPARDAPIESIEDHRDEDGDAGVLKFPVDRSDDCIEAGKQCPRREQVRQPVHPPVSRSLNICVVHECP